jgi:hypothetical protein
MAAKWGHLEVAKLLLQRGADPVLTSASGLTPMAYAMANGHYEIQDLLMHFVSTDSRMSNSMGELGGAQNATQEYWLTGLITSPCTSCTAFRVDYEVSEGKKRAIRAVY